MESPVHRKKVMGVGIVRAAITLLVARRTITEVFPVPATPVLLVLELDQMAAWISTSVIRIRTIAPTMRHAQTLSEVSCVHVPTAIPEMGTHVNRTTLTNVQRVRTIVTQMQRVTTLRRDFRALAMLASPGTGFTA
jgi:hypothetical protein